MQTQGIGLLYSHSKVCGGHKGGLTYFHFNGSVFDPHLTVKYGIVWGMLLLLVGSKS